MLTFAQIREAQERISPFLFKTPVLRSPVLDEIAGHPVFFKCENLQLGGAFKARGAFNAVYSLTADEASRGVATHSSGNHAGALALAARSRGIPAYIVMPRNVSSPKTANVRRSGAEILFCDPTVEAREKTAAEIVARTGAHLIHPYNDLSVMAGQGTAALELLDEISDLEAILIPVSGGGLAAGTTVAAKSRNPEIRVLAVEPEGAADAWESFHQGKLVPAKNPETIADGLRASLGSLTYPIIRDQIDDIVTVSEQGIVRAMRQLWEELRVVVEPSSAVPWAAVLENKIQCRDKTAMILTGGNVDLDCLPWLENDRV